jgi:hypothetical protein
MAAELSSFSRQALSLDMIYLCHDFSESHVGDMRQMVAFMSKYQVV